MRCQTGLLNDERGLADGGLGASAYSDAISIYLGVATSRWSDFSNTICSWNQTNQNIRVLFAMHTIPMSWDYAELSPFSSVGPWFSAVESIFESLPNVPASPDGHGQQEDARDQKTSKSKVVATDPPYYDNIGYADLSDFFYMWLRRSLRQIYPSLFSTLTVPKTQELIAATHRQGSTNAAARFFISGMTQAMQCLANQAHPAFPVIVYYAFKQAESESDGTTSTGWETFLEALLQVGFALTGTWPIRTEKKGRVRDIGSNALASSIILVCRPRPADAPLTTRRDFLSALKRELPIAMRQLQKSDIAPVDLAQASIGPGMAVFTRYSKVLESDGTPMRVRTALQLINQTLDEALAEQENEFDPDTRWALAWFEQMGFNDGPYGDAETLSKAKNTAINGLVSAGVVQAKAGKVRLLRVDELPLDWNPATDKRLTAWETVHHLIRALNIGEAAAAQLAAQLGGQAEVARELAYRLYTICERRKRAVDALAYNGLVQSWPEIIKLARESGAAQPAQTKLL